MARVKFSNRKSRLAAACALAALVTFAGGGCSWWDDDANDAALLYWDDLSALGNVSLTEQDLSQRQIPYIAVDAEREFLQVKVAGVPVREIPMRLLAADSAGIAGFTRRWHTMRGSRANRISGVHLSLAEDVWPESILVIVGEDIGVDPELMRRSVPQRFTVTWSGGLMLDVRTPEYVEPTGFFARLPELSLNTVHRLFGGERLVIEIAPLDAVTLYRMATEGTPVVYYPPKALATQTHRTTRPQAP